MTTSVGSLSYSVYPELDEDASKIKESISGIYENLHQEDHLAPDILTAQLEECRDKISSYQQSLMKRLQSPHVYSKYQQYKYSSHQIIHDHKQPDHKRFHELLQHESNLSGFASALLDLQEMVSMGQTLSVMKTNSEQEDPPTGAPSQAHQMDQMGPDSDHRQSHSSGNKQHRHGAKQETKHSSKTIQRDLISTLHRTRQNMGKTIEATADAHTTLLISGETLAAINVDAHNANLASETSKSLVSQHERKAFMRRSAIRLSFLFFMCVAGFVVLHRLLWLFSPAIYITKPFIQIIQLIATALGLVFHPLIEFLKPTLARIIPGLM